MTRQTDHGPFVQENLDDFLSAIQACVMEWGDQIKRLMIHKEVLLLNEMADHIGLALPCSFMEGVAVCRYCYNNKIRLHLGFNDRCHGFTGHKTSWPIWIRIGKGLSSQGKGVTWP